MAPSAVSFNPQTFVEGGLIDDVDVEFVEVQFCAYDYNGASPEAVLALGVKMRTTGDDGQPKDVDQYYSAGDLQNFLPSDDGYSLVPQSDKASLNRNTNVAKFFESLMTASQGQLQGVLDSGSVQGLVGLKCHMNRVAQPKRSGIIRTGKNADREPSILLVSRIVAFPGQAPVSGAGKNAVTAATARIAANANVAKPAVAAPAKIGMGNKAATPAPAPAKPGNGAAAPGTIDPAVDELAAATLIEILVAAPNGQLEKKNIPPKAFQSETLKGNPLKQKVVSRIFEDTFLSTVDGITFDGARVSMA